MSQIIRYATVNLEEFFVFKVCLFQYCLVIISAVCTSIAFAFGSLALLPTDSFGAKFFYAFMMVSLYAFLPGSYAAYPPAIDVEFGPKYSAHTYGIVFESGVRITYNLRNSQLCYETLA